MLKVLLVDDEPLARRNLLQCLNHIPGAAACAEAGNGEEAILAVEREQPDIILLDIQMPGMDAFEFVRALPDEIQPFIIFVTAYDNYAVRAFEVNAVDYLLKPVRRDRLEEALSRCCENRTPRLMQEHRNRLINSVESLAHSSTQRIAIKEGEEYTLLETSHISHIETAGNYICVHADDQVYIVRKTLKKIAEELDPNIFRQIHRGILVNIHHVRAIAPHINSEYIIKLQNGDRLKVSRTYRQNVRQFLETTAG